MSSPLAGMSPAPEIRYILRGYHHETCPWSHGSGGRCNCLARKERDIQAIVTVTKERREGVA